MIARLKVNDFELRQMIFAELDQRFSSPKNRRRALQIVEAALTCLARHGYDGVTLGMIAREAGVTRPLVTYYFTDLADVLKTATRYVRLLFQKLAVDALLGGSSADEMLGRYVDACFYWVETHRAHARVWLGFVLDGATRAAQRALNSAAVRRGEERIEALLNRGREQGVFEFTDARNSARMIQSLITGGILSYGSEDMPDRRAYAVNIREACLNMVRARAVHHRLPVRSERP